MSGRIPSTSSSSNLNTSMNTSTSSVGSASSGCPVQIVDITKEHKFKLNEENLQSILNHPKARMKKVCVVSVAGAFRKGKSFLLDFFLRYLGRNGREDWMGAEDEPLTGFHWKGGSERDTTGILMWSEPFVLKRPETKEEVILCFFRQILSLHSNFKFQTDLRFINGHTRSFRLAEHSQRLCHRVCVESHDQLGACVQYNAEFAGGRLAASAFVHRIWQDCIGRIA